MIKTINNSMDAIIVKQKTVLIALVSLVIVRSYVEMDIEHRENNAMTEIL